MRDEAMRGDDGARPRACARVRTGVRRARSADGFRGVGEPTSPRLRGAGPRASWSRSWLLLSGEENREERISRPGRCGNRLLNLSLIPRRVNGADRLRGYNGRDGKESERRGCVGGEEVGFRLRRRSGHRRSGGPASGRGRAGCARVLLRRRPFGGPRRRAGRPRGARHHDAGDGRVRLLRERFGVKAAFPSCCSPPRTRRSTRWSASSWAPTTTWSSPSSPASSWRACAPACAAPPPPRAACWRRAGSRSTRTPTRRRCTARRFRSRPRSSPSSRAFCARRAAPSPRAICSRRCGRRRPTSSPTTR